MITLATPIVRRITRLRVIGARGLDLLSDETGGRIIIETSAPGSSTIESHAVVVLNGRCSGLADDGQGMLAHADVHLPTGLDELRTVIGAAVGVAAKKQAVETWLIAQGLLPAGTVI